ncbi:MAG: hypothetical protein JRN71_06290 [Nitrososphaerota archaeon]|nr:hypothetical protein [Nitrososphaerota archaeon]
MSRVEELSQNAWPPPDDAAGWVGPTVLRRVRQEGNSVNSLYRGAVGAERKASVCEGAYSRRGLDMVFKLAPASVPANLHRGGPC